MKDPTRLLDAPASELEQHLLRAGVAEQPPSAAMERLAEKLGVSVSAGHAPAKLPLLAASKSVLIIGVATLATLATITAVGLITARTSEPRTLPEAQQRPTAGPTESAPVAPADTAPVRSSDSLAQEIAKIDAVRRELAANRAKPAIAGLQEYQRDFPGGVLRQEAELLNIEAHREAGDRRRARTLAARFLANNPESPHTARVRDLLQDLGPDAR
ncbi:MAG TPA: hypothetical protein VMF89_16085 [Polyangiales bacterium]|nr:hypothetical protein [Polyangiales bacterium]